MIAKLLKYFKKSPLLAFIKFEPTFLTGSLAVCLSAPVQGGAGGGGGWGEFRPPSPESSVRIFLNRHRQTKKREKKSLAFYIFIYLALSVPSKFFNPSIRVLNSVFGTGRFLFFTTGTIFSNSSAAFLIKAISFLLKHLLGSFAA